MYDDVVVVCALALDQVPAVVIVVGCLVEWFGNYEVDGHLCVRVGLFCE